MYILLEDFGVHRQSALGTLCGREIDLELDIRRDIYEFICDFPLFITIFPRCTLSFLVDVTQAVQAGKMILKFTVWNLNLKRSLAGDEVCENSCIRVSAS